MAVVKLQRGCGMIGMWLCLWLWLCCDEVAMRLWWAFGVVVVGL